MLQLDGAVLELVLAWEDWSESILISSARDVLLQIAVHDDRQASLVFIEAESSTLGHSKVCWAAEVLSSFQAVYSLAVF